MEAIQWSLIPPSNFLPSAQPAYGPPRFSTHEPIFGPVRNAFRTQIPPPGSVPGHMVRSHCRTRWQTTAGGSRFETRDSRFEIRDQADLYASCISQGGLWRENGKISPWYTISTNVLQSTLPSFSISFQPRRGVFLPIKSWPVLNNYHGTIMYTCVSKLTLFTRVWLYHTCVAKYLTAVCI